MKTAVSVPNEVFGAAERLARRTRKSRSALYSCAVAEYVARHEPESVTEAMDKTLARISDEPDALVSVAARRVLKRNRW